MESVYVHLYRTCIIRPVWLSSVDEVKDCDLVALFSHHTIAGAHVHLCVSHSYCGGTAKNSCNRQVSSHGTDHVLNTGHRWDLMVVIHVSSTQLYRRDNIGSSSHAVLKKHTPHKSIHKRADELHRKGFSQQLRSALASLS